MNVRGSETERDKRGRPVKEPTTWGVSFVLRNLPVFFFVFAFLEHNHMGSVATVSYYVVE